MKQKKPTKAQNPKDIKKLITNAILTDLQNKGVSKDWLKTHLIVAKL